MFFEKKVTSLPTKSEALKGRSEAIEIPSHHFVTGNSIKLPFPNDYQVALFGLGCFWGAEKCFWSLNGVFSTSVGYAGGFTPNPSYEEVCSGLTGHNEVVQVVFDPLVISFPELLAVFWQSHNPTEGMGQGNDQGTQYRSGIYCYDQQQLDIAKHTQQQYQQKLTQAGYASITTEIIPVADYYYAEEYHQQYLAKNPSGYCGLGGTGVGL